MRIIRITNINIIINNKAVIIQVPQLSTLQIIISTQSLTSDQR